MFSYFCVFLNVTMCSYLFVVIVSLKIFGTSSEVRYYMYINGYHCTVIALLLLLLSVGVM